MAKDNRNILSAVRFKGTVYKPGMEDELSAAMNQGQLDRLMDRGALGGDFVAVAGAEPKPPSESELAKMSKAKLVAVADSEGAEVTPDSQTNKQIISAILENRKSQ